MHTQGGAYQLVYMQTAAVAVGNGAVVYPTENSMGAFNTLTAQITGITTATITWEGTMNGTDWSGFLMAPVTTGTGALTATANSICRGTVAGFTQVRARISAWTSGTIYVIGILSNT
jgi:hypothetical protein